MKGIVITPEEEISIQDFSSPLYAALEPVLGGHAEHVAPLGLKRPYCMMVNENGLNLGLEINPVGCVFYETHKHGYPIVGNIVILMDRQSYGGGYETVGIPDYEVEAMYNELLTEFNLKAANGSANEGKE